MQSSTSNGQKTIAQKSGREIFGLLLAPLASIPIQLLISPVSDVVGNLIGVYLLFAIFGIPAHLLFRAVGLLKPWHFVFAGATLGALLPLFLIWLINPSLWMLGQRWAIQEDLLTTAVFIVSSVAISGVFWLAAFAPAQRLRICSHALDRVLHLRRGRPRHRGIRSEQQSYRRTHLPG